MELHLTTPHLDEMRDIVLACDNYKKQNLKSSKSYALWYDWALKAADQINDNHFEINSVNKNTFVWLVDQIQHCPSVAATTLGKSVLAWAPMASLGPLSYHRYCQKQQYDKLFGV
jgi:hypothetical protein